MVLASRKATTSKLNDCAVVLVYNFPEIPSAPFSTQLNMVAAVSPPPPPPPLLVVPGVEKLSLSVREPVPSGIRAISLLLASCVEKSIPHSGGTDQVALGVNFP